MPFTVAWTKTTILQLVKWQYLMRDEGDDENTTLLLQEDTIPAHSITDSWAGDCVEVVIVSNYSLVIRFYLANLPFAQIFFFFRHRFTVMCVKSVIIWTGDWIQPTNILTTNTESSVNKQNRISPKEIKTKWQAHESNPWVSSKDGTGKETTSSKTGNQTITL